MLFFFIVNLLFFSCKKPDITPAYLLLSVEDFKDCIDVSNFEKDHEISYDKTEFFKVIKQHNFTDAHVSINGQELGYWQLPCKIPLLPDYSGINIIRITPCVRLISTSLTTVQYRFLTPVEQSFEMEREKEYRLSNLKFEYVKSVDFPILETFEQATIIFKSIDSLNGVPITVDTVGEKGKVGKIVLDDSLKYFNIATSFFTLDGYGVRKFWEMDYRCDHGEATTYLDFRNTTSGFPHQDLIVLRATEGWKKIYIDITDVVDGMCGSALSVSVRLGIRGLPNIDAKNACFYFENIKIITMNAIY